MVSQTYEALILSNITFDGLKIKLTYDSTPKSGQLPSTNDFMVKSKDGQNLAIENIIINENSLVITLAAPLSSGEPIIMVSYTPGLNPIEDQAGNTAEGFSNKTVTSQSEKLDTKTEINDPHFNEQWSVFSNVYDPTMDLDVNCQRAKQPS